MPSETDLPDAQALLAGTLALMSAWAHPSPDAKMAPSALRGVLRKKIVSNLFFLLHHPVLDPHMRQVARNLHQQWEAHGPACSANPPCMAEPSASVRPGDNPTLH